MTKIAINGLGRIGRPTLKRILEKHPDLDIVAVNDLANTETLAHLLKYDSSYGIYGKSVKAKEKEISIDGKKILVFAETDPLKLPWKDLGIDIVLDCTGYFRDEEGAGKHLKAGAKEVIISAPGKSETIPSFILGINEEKFDAEKDKIVDMGSCTTNCLAPIVKVLNENFKIINGFITTIHSYTGDQRLLDSSHKDLRRARAAALNIIPTTTGATKAIGKVIPELKGRLDGIAMRIPTPTVSILDLFCHIEKKSAAEEINYVLKKASQEERFKGILGVEDALLDSSDDIGNSFSSIVDSSLTMAKDDLVKIVSWYDNEYGYACRLAEFAEFISKKI